MVQSIELFVADRVQEYAWKQDLNCAQTTLLVLSEKFNVELNSQIIDGSTGLNGAGQYRAQCGLVEGALIFMGIYLRTQNKEKQEIQTMCKTFAQSFENKFGSLSCSQLRPNGFNLTDPPHLCSNLTEKTLLFAIHFILNYKPI